MACLLSLLWLPKAELSLYAGVMSHRSMTVSRYMAVKTPNAVMANELTLFSKRGARQRALYN